MKIECKLTRETISFSELTVRDYKNFLKETYGDDLNPNHFMDVVYNLLQKLTEKPLIYIKNLSVIDLLCLLIEVRINSVGDTCDIIIKTNKANPIKVQLNLDGLKEDLMILDQYVSKVISLENVILGFKCPSIERINSSTEEYLSFIHKVIIKDKELLVTTNDQAELIFNSLPPKMSLEIIDVYKQLVNVFSEFNLLERYSIVDQTINFLPAADHLMWLVKLLFGEPLQTFYDTFFHMCYTGHMDATYLEQLTVGEYKYFISCLLKAIANSNQSSEEQAPSEENV